MTVNAFSAVIVCPKSTNAAKVALIIRFGVRYRENIEMVPLLNL